MGSSSLEVKDAASVASPTPDVIIERREMMRQWEQKGMEALGPLSESLEEFWITIKLPDGWESKAKVVRPKDLSSSKKHPLIVYFFGGGFSAGSPDQVVRPARDFAEKFGAVVVLPTYRLAPEVRWPVPFRDGWQILEYLSQTAETELGANLSGPDGGFIVGGISAGGCIAAVSTGIFMYGDGTGNSKPLGKPLTGAFVAIPFLLTKEMVPEEFKSLWTSREDNKNAPGLDSAAIDEVVENTQPDLHSPWFSPFNLTTDKPPKTKIPVYVQACQHDPLRDDGILYEKFLASKGVRTKIDVFPDDGHAAWATIPLPNNSKNPTIAEAVMGGMQWLLQG